MTRTPLAWVSMSGADPSFPGDVVVYDMGKEKIVGMISVGIDPRHLAWFPQGDKVYVPNCGSDTVSVIQCRNLSVEKTIPVGKCPKSMVINPKESKGYIANYADHSITVIDLLRDEVIATIPVGQNPIGLAISSDSKRLYATQHSSHTLSLIDTEHNQVVGTLPLGAYPNDLALSPDQAFLYIVITGENRISVIHIELQKEITSIPVGQNPQRIALHPTRPLAYITNFDSHSISIISTLEHQVLGTIPNIVAPFDLRLDPDGSRLWVTNDYQLTIIETENHNIISTLYAPPSAQIRQGLAYSESDQEFTTTEVCQSNNQRPYSFVTERLYFKSPKPFDLTIHIEFPTPSAKAEGLVLGNAEVKAHSVSILPVPMRPNYYYLAFAFRIPYKISYRDHHNQPQELQDAVHHALSGVEIHLPPSRTRQSLKLKVVTQSEVINKSVPTPNSLILTLRTQIVAMQQVQAAD